MFDVFNSGIVPNQVTFNLRNLVSIDYQKRVIKYNVKTRVFCNKF